MKAQRTIAVEYTPFIEHPCFRNTLQMRCSLRTVEKGKAPCNRNALIASSKPKWAFKRRCGIDTKTKPSLAYVLNDLTKEGFKSIAKETGLSLEQYQSCRELKQNSLPAAREPTHKSSKTVPFVGGTNDHSLNRAVRGKPADSGPRRGRAVMAVRYQPMKIYGASAAIGLEV